MGLEPATAGRHSLEMASSEAKDSSLVHFISFRGFCVLVLAPSTSCSLSSHAGLGYGHSTHGLLGGEGSEVEGANRHGRHCPYPERKEDCKWWQEARNERVVKCVCE